MGGYGSGWQGAKKATVEGSLVLTAASLVRKTALVPGSWSLHEKDQRIKPGKSGYEYRLFHRHGRGDRDR